MIARLHLVTACLAACFPALSCSEETAPTPPDAGKKVEPAPDVKQPNPAEEDVKKLLALVRDRRKMEGERPPDAEQQKKMEALMKEANATMTRLTGLPPDAEGFDKAAFGTLVKAAEKHDPAFHSELINQEKKMAGVMTQARLNNLRSALEMFHMDQARYPTKEEGLEILVKGTERMPPSLHSDKELKDGWDRPFFYQPGENGAYRVFSAGPDGKEGTEDDIRLEE